MTAQADARATRIRHELRLRLLDVAAVRRVTPHLARITLAGDQLQGFSSPGFDDHVKVFFPTPGERFDRVPAMGPNGPVFDERPMMRDFTPHHHDASAGTLQLDFVLHESGPATAWAQQARPGDTLLIGGPRGSSIVDQGFDWHLLVGDDTALPAMRRRLAELSAASKAVVFAEVDGPADQEPFESCADVAVHWVHRQDSPTRLLHAVAAADLPPGSPYA